jgi:ATP-binding cassette subfamily F protein 3
LRADESPLQHLARMAPQELEQKLRDYLGGFGFQGDKVSEETRRFSGEKARLVLALIVWQRPNLLLLDEPTNHLISICVRR